MNVVAPLVGAYWSGRMIQADALVANTLSLLEGVRSEFGMSAWYPRASRAKWHDHPIAFTPQSLAALLTATSDAVPRYSLRFWNGSFHSPTTVAIDCAPPHHWQPSSIVIHLPIDASPDDRAIDTCGRFLNLIVGSWDPDYAVATTISSLALHPPITGKCLKGWYVYNRGTSVTRTSFRPR